MIFRGCMPLGIYKVMAIRVAWHYQQSLSAVYSCHIHSLVGLKCMDYDDEVPVAIFDIGNKLILCAHGSMMMYRGALSDLV